MTARRPAAAGILRARHSFRSTSTSASTRGPAVLTAILGVITLTAGAMLLTPPSSASAGNAHAGVVAESFAEATAAVGAAPSALAGPAAPDPAAPAPDAPEPDAAAPDAAAPDAATPDAPTPDATTPTAPDPARSAPMITGPAEGSFVGQFATTISGTRMLDQTIHVLSPTGGDPLCVREPDGTTSWTCAAALQSSPSVTVRVVDGSDRSLSDEVTLRVLTPPVVTGGALSPTVSNGMVRGWGYPAASIAVSLSNGLSCTTQADQSGAWACLFDRMRTSGTFGVAASQSTAFSAPSSSARSTPVSLAFDLDRPAAPAVTTPAANDRLPLTGTTYAGTGEPGTTVTVFVESSSLCETAVLWNGTWKCFAAGVTAGTFAVRAIQQDEAGNVGPASPAVVVGYGPAPVESPPTAADGPAAVPAPAAPVPAARPTPAPAPAPVEAAPGSPPTSSPNAAPPSDGASPPNAAPRDTPDAQSTVPPGQARPSGPLSGGWNDPTRFAAAISPPGGADAFPWWQAVLLALAALVLVAIPARLLAGTISRARNGHPLWGEQRFAGRNRARIEYETAPDVRLNRRLIAGAALLAAAALVMLSGPIEDQPAYLRLFGAVLVALVLVNAVGMLVPLWWGRRVLRVRTSVTFLPRYLLLVAITALGSRLFGIEPAILFGLLGSVAIPAGLEPAVRGRLAAVRASSLVALAVIGWLVLGVLPEASGFLPALTAEVMNAVVLASLGSAVLVLIPIGTTSGRGILSWSPLGWTAITITAFTILFGVLSPRFDVGGSLLAWVAAGSFAAFSVGAWAWQRFVSPALN